MIDFMANIKNKKNMTMCNIKTLVATSVLCVFFNGVAIYGMHDPTDMKNNGGEPLNLNYNGNVGGKGNDNNIEVAQIVIEKNNGPSDKNNKNKHFNHKDFEKKKGKDKCFPPYCYNYKGNFSLLFCFNFCNGPESNGEENHSVYEDVFSLHHFDQKDDGNGPEESEEKSEKSEKGS